VEVVERACVEDAVSGGNVCICVHICAHIHVGMSVD